MPGVFGEIFFYPFNKLAKFYFHGEHEMNRFIIYFAVAVLLIHALIHLMGFVAYFPLAEMAELPYRTTLLGGRWDIGPTGMRIYSVLWLAVTAGMLAGAVGLVLGQDWWLPLLSIVAFLSLVVCVLDWSNAFRGAIISLVILLFLLPAWGLHIRPKPFADFPQPTQLDTAVPLPADLPAPVARYYQTIFGDEVPVVDTAVITARGTVRFAGITFPSRLRFTHNAGQDYRHYIESTVFGYPLMKVNEAYREGQARMELPVGIIENEPKVDMAANLGLWGESMWLPSIFVTDSRVHWEAIDDTTARLYVPFEDGEDNFTVYFDAETGLIQRMETMRYREVDAEKILWQLTPLAWTEINGILIPSISTATWADEGTPWLVVDIEDVVYNADIGSYLYTTGP